MAAAEFPETFEDLAEWHPAWCLESESARHFKRVNSDLDSVRAFYDAVLPRMDEIIRYLNTLSTIDPKQLARPDRNLYYLAATCIEMSHPIDMKWRTTDIDDKFPSERLEFSDLPNR